MWVLALVLLLVLFGLGAVARNQKAARTAASATEELRLDEFGARRLLADGREEQVDWTELTQVEVVRADRGPHGEAGGVVMLSGDETRGCLVPLDRLGECGLLEHLERLPGFDVHAFVAALDARPSTRTTCWERATEPPPA